MSGETLSFLEAALRLGYSPSHVAKLVAHGLLQARGDRIPTEAIEVYEAEQARRGQALAELSRVSQGFADLEPPQ